MLHGAGLGGRLALLHALRYPEDVGALILSNVPAGQRAAMRLSRTLYTALVDTAAIYNVQGMTYVARELRFAANVTGRDENLRLLRGTPFDLFKLRMDTWSQPLAAGGDPLLYPVLALEGARVRAIAAPALVGFDAAAAAAGGRDRDEALTTPELSEALAACFPGLVGEGASKVDDAAAWADAAVAFVAALPQPLPTVPLRFAAVAAAASVAATTRTWARTVFGGEGASTGDARANSVSSVDQREANISAAVDGAAGTRSCAPSSFGDMLGLTVGSAGEDAVVTVIAAGAAVDGAAGTRSCAPSSFGDMLGLTDRVGSAGEEAVVTMIAAGASASMAEAAAEAAAKRNCSMWGAPLE